jgi:SAM-dependent methyltransferase
MRRLCVTNGFWVWFTMSDKQVSEADVLGSQLPPGSNHYRAFVGYPLKYDLIAAMQFNLLTSLGLREHHHVLDLGCGSLRAGRLLIPYLLPNCYYGLEPEEWLVEDGIRYNTGRDLIEIKSPHFQYRSDFSLTAFGVQFDFILAQSIFSHASPSQIRKCLSEAAACLAPGALLVASFVLDKEDYDGDTWVYPTCIGYTESGMKRFAAEAALECTLIDWPHPNAQSWALFWRSGTRGKPRDPTYLYAKPCVHELQTQPVEEDSGAGFLDGVWDVGDCWLLYGWAVDQDRNCPTDFVLVTQGNQVIASGRIEVERTDVAAVLGDTLLRSGFRVRLAKDIPRAGHELRCYGYISETGKMFALAGSFMP